MNLKVVKPYTDIEWEISKEIIKNTPYKERKCVDCRNKNSIDYTCYICERMQYWEPKI